MRKFILTMTVLMVSSFAMMALAATFTVQLRDNGGNHLSDESTADLKYYESGWKSATYIGNGDFEITTSSANLSIKMYYAGGSEQASNVPTSATYTFNTVPVVVSLVSSTNVALAGGDVKYYASGWKTFGTTDGSGTVTKELLPVSYSFKMYYEGASQQISNQNVGSNPNVAFQTTLVTVSLSSSTNVALSGGDVKYYASGWKTFGTTDGTGTTTKELLPVSYSFKMYYEGGSEQISNQDVGVNPLVSFQTISVTVNLVTSLNAPISGGDVKYYASGWKTFGTTDATGAVSKELLPISYSFKMYYLGGSEQQSNINTGVTPIITFQTTLVTTELKNCSGVGIEGANVKYYASGWKDFGTTDINGIATLELLPVSYSFKVYLNGASNQISNQNVGANNLVSFSTVSVTLNYTGTIKFYASGWKTFNQPLMEMLPGTYQFKFYGTGGFDFQQAIDLTGCAYGGNVFAFRTLKADGSALPNIPIARNDYGSHYAPVGATDANGWLFTTDLPAGTWKYRASKNYSNQYFTAGPSLVTFQTAKYVAHVKHTDGSDFAGIATEYNDYGSHWIDMEPSLTDANGTASIELFPGNFKFKASKNYSAQTAMLELTNSGDVGTVEFQTSTFTAHVKMQDGSDFEGIATEYNDYGSHWIDLDPNATDVNGNASIELFPGNFKFRATKNYSVQENMLEITTSGTTDVVEFQTALAVGFIRDCDLDQGVAGIQVEYNDYGSHWIDLSPTLTAADGKASIELFPGTFDLRAKNIYTSESKPITLVNSGDIVTVEFNPTRVNFHYPGTVRYNDYGSHWYIMSGDNYMFPGTYDFRFYTGGTIDLQQSIAISGCVFEKAAIFVQLKNSLGNGLPDADFIYRFGYGSYTTIGTDATGNGIWYFIDGDPGNTKVKIAYRGATKEVEQNVKINPAFIFNTVKVTAELLSSTNADLTNDASWQFRFGYDPYATLDPVNGEELLPVNTKVRVTYKGASQEKEQNINLNANFGFNTVLVTAQLLSSVNADLTTDATWQYRFGFDPYSTLDPINGEELLPLNTKVKVTYKGASKEIEQNTNLNTNFVFNTVLVTAQLLSSVNADLTADATWQYRFGFDPYSTLDPVNGEELLPLNTKVKVSYKGTSKEIEQNTNINPSFDFNTVLVIASLTDGGFDVTSSATWQYRYGFDAYNAFNPLGEELLAANTKVKVTYASTSDEKEQNVGTAPVYTFTYDGSTISKLGLAVGTTLNLTTYPNPANLVANVTYTVPRDALVLLSVFDLAGNEVSQLHSGDQIAGNYVYEWDVRNMTPGTYIVRLIVGETITYERIVVAK